MKNISIRRFYHLSVALLLAGSLLGLNACSDKKGAAPGGDGSNIGGQAGGAGLQCAEGEFADASGQAKRGLKLQKSLYYALQDQMSHATMLAAQDVFVRGDEIYYARSVPSHIVVTPGSGAAIHRSTLQPTLSLKFFEKDGQLILAAGNFAGIDYYTVSASDLTPLASNHHLGAVTDLSARDGMVCAVADGGKAVVSTSPDASGAGPCSSILYEAGNHTAANGAAMEATHVAAVPEGCLVVTRNQPKLQVKLMELVDFVRSFISSTPQRIDLRGVEEKLLLLGKDGSSREIKPVVGSYDKLVISDLDMTSDGAVASYTAFRKDNWDGFSSVDMTAQPLRKIWMLLKLFAEVRGGGLFIVNGEVKKNAELQGAPVTFNLPYPGGTVTLNEFPHFSLPWFPEGAVDGNRYGLKTILSFSIFDFSGLNDPNVASLPVEQYTWNNTPGNPLSQPDNPKGLFTNFGLGQKKLFTNGLGSGGLQSNYDYDAAAKVVMNAPPYPTTYKDLPAKFNIRAFPLGSLRNGYFGLKIGGGTGLFYKKAEPGAPMPPPFLPGAHFAANGITYPGTYNLSGLPVTYESPAGEANDKFVLAYHDKTNSKLIVEALKPDGAAAAISAAEATIDPAPEIGAALAPVAVFEDVVVVGMNVINGGNPEWRLFAWSVDGAAQKLNFMGDTATPANAHFANGAAGTAAMSIKSAGRTDAGIYSVLVLQRGSGGNDKIVRVDFTHNGSKVLSADVHDAAVTDPVDLVVGAGKAFAVTNGGDVIPLDLGGNNISAGASLGKIVDGPNPKIYLSFCGMNGADIYCSGMFKSSLFALYKFSTESKEQTTFKYNRPILLSFTGSKLLVSYSLDGAGIEAFDVTKPAPEPAAGGGAAGGNITTGDGSGTPGTGGSGVGGVPAGGAMGGGGCSLTTRAQTAGIGALFVMACLIGGAMTARRLRRLPARR
ncbi:MAG: hypothetical protein IT573_04670 [Deltaproteobacteria bacterium]|nr:hypothetical protein [Deltaproteobacteria bacterium]